MRWYILDLIWRREMRDFLRDRRTIVVIFLLPLVLYPLLGLVGLQFALSMMEQKSVIGIHGVEHLPGAPLSTLAWFTATPANPGLDRVMGATALAQVSEDYPPLLVNGQFSPNYFDADGQGRNLRVQVLASTDLAPLETRQVDLILIIPPGFRSRLEEGGKPKIRLFAREADERSRMADRRLREVVYKWSNRLKEVRLQGRGLSADFDQPFELDRPQEHQEPEKRKMDELAEALGKFLPFLLIMWAMAGALYPAIDVCAGEKERGTMETLLISPASRAEIVHGKFLAIWFFSSVTALWNLAWMGGGVILANLVLPHPVIRTTGLVWCILLTILMAALFSAISLALGTFARSTKEGQYYLAPLFIVTMPLAFLPMMPGVELNLGYSLLPVTGPTLLLQQFLLPVSRQPAWRYVFPVLASLALSIWLALRWAVALFQREEVLFRQAQAGGGLGDWLRRLTGRS